MVNAMDTIDAFEKVQNDLTQTARHGYAVYTGEIMFTWTLTLELALAQKRTTRIVNVQNGFAFNVSNGQIL